MPHHTKITKEDRIVIGTMRRSGYSLSEIGTALGNHRLSISRELSRNRSKNTSGYHSKIAQNKYLERKRDANQHFCIVKGDSFLENFVRQGLEQYWSPEQVSGVLYEEYDRRITLITIYRYIYAHAPDLMQYLRQKTQWRRKKGTIAKMKKAREMEQKRCITERPEDVDQKSRIGDWEGDTIWSSCKKMAIVTLLERTSGYLLARLVQSKEAYNVRQAMIEELSQVPYSKRKTITLDNGVEFSQWDTVEEKIGIEVYFAHPYSSWERGANENVNGLLRQFFPKKSSFATLKQQDIQRVVDLINSRPRKRHRYHSPMEVFHGVAIRTKM